MYTEWGKDWSRFEVREKFSNWWEAFNIFDLNPFKKRCTEINKEIKISKKTDGDN